jgi:hypothetical protein
MINPTHILNQVQTFQGFPVFRAHCPKCATGGSVELVATIPKDNISNYIACCFACPSNWKHASTPEEAVQNFMSGIANE